MAETQLDEIKHGNYELFMMGVALLSLFNLALGVLTYNQEQLGVILIMDFLLSFILIGDFFYRLYQAPQRARYFFREFGWLDLLGSLPLRWIRLFRLLRIVRLLRALQKAGVHALQQQVTEHTANIMMYGVLFLVIVVIELGSFAILGVEPYAPNSNIETASDALWWSVVTVATVGYGDRYPVTNPGRIIGIFVMVSGVGLFSVLTSFMAQGFIRRRQHRAGKRAELPGEGQADDLYAGRLARLEQLLAEQEALTGLIKKEMAELVETAGK